MKREFLAEMIAHSKECYPNEACGIIAGLDGAAVRVYRAKNSAKSPDRYKVDPRQQLHILTEMEERGWELFGIYHSHIRSPAYPSHTDVELAYYSEARYFIVSLMHGEPVVRAFRIIGGKIEEEHVVEQSR